MTRSIWKCPPNGIEWVKGKLVGSGSFGTVHLAMNKSTGGIFVVKSAHSLLGSGRCEALENEVTILKSLRSSPYIVECLGTDEDGGGNLNVFIEYMPGGSLADVAHKFGGSLDEEMVRVYTREILHGLQHVHQQGIVHCDLKCKNVLLGSAGNVKLADFGCAKRMVNGGGGGGGSIGGTPLWMAPEVLRNETLDVAADIWSLGCTVIEMATGRPPWAGDGDGEVSSSNPMAAMLRIAHGDGIPQLPTHFSREGLDFLTKCFERDPKKRCNAQDLLYHPFVSTRSSHKEYASSPTSVFELVQGFEDDLDYDDEVQSSPPENQFRINNNSFDELEGTTIFWQLADNALGSSGNWITVRSG